MKPLLLVAAVALALGLPVAALAQQPTPAPLARGDVAGTIGWLNGNKSDLTNLSTNDWYNRGLYAGAIAGWYWTDHHKTQVEAGLTNSISFWTYRLYTFDTTQASGGSRFAFTLKRVALGQHYQFYRNAWVHPHVGAGVDLTWERTIEHAEPVIGYDVITHAAKQLRPGGTFGPTWDLRVRPYAEAGFKAYMTPRAFFRGDMRVLVRGGVDEVLLRCGFGVDF